MGQQCSCLQHPRKLRRPSDTNASDSEDEALDILIDGCGARDEPKRGPKLQADDEEDATEDRALLGGERERLRGLDRGLMAGGAQSVLRSYQAATGVVDPGELDLECIMCLDTFSTDNPKVRTLCNCGMNRTNFHLSCLLEWLNRDRNCPVCREYLYYEDM